MPIQIGESGTLFNTTIPDLTDVANIQNAFRFYHYGNNAGSPATAATAAADSIYSHLKTISDKIGTIATDRVLISSTISGQIKIVSSDITTTKLGYLSDVTSAIQAQLDLKSPIANPTFTGTVSGTFSGNLTGTASNATAVVHYKATSGGDYSAVTPTNKIFTGQTQPTTGMTVGDIWMW
jgi:hypothetical protein